jgi:hypothetical protein
MLYGEPEVNLFNYVALVRLEVKSDRRELQMMFVSNRSLWWPKDHVISVSIEEVSGKPGNRVNLYKITPTSPLPAGEYCLIWIPLFYFDFGVDTEPKL